MSFIYEPNEDSYFLSEILEKKITKLLLKNLNLKVLEIGCGSGIQLKKLKSIGVKKLMGIDVNPDAVEFCKKNGFKVFESNLFSKIKEKFDVIIFNPPYLPENTLEDENSKLATTGGKLGGETINKFLRNAKNYLNKNGKIFLLISSLTKGINWLNYKKKVVGEKKLFFEKLEILELTI